MNWIGYSFRFAYFVYCHSMPTAYVCVRTYVQYGQYVKYVLILYNVYSMYVRTYVQLYVVPGILYLVSNP